MTISVPKVNPKCRKFDVGVRVMRTITLYPLSLADELSFSETIISLVGGYETVVNQPLPEIDPEDDVLQEEQIDNMEIRIAVYIISAIKENLVEILAFVTDEAVTLSDIDNEQFIELCDAIFEMNFDGAVGKGLRLLNKVKNLFPQKTLSENLSSPLPTDTNISSNSAIETEA